MSFKGRALKWEQFKEQNPSQTAVMVTYSSPSYKPLQTPFTRVLLGNFSSREQAWDWCKRVGMKRGIIDKDEHSILREVKLLKLSKLIREYSDSKPTRTSAFILS